jgi:CubicO group peptidase (beta-lactamase class C family)
MAIILATKGLAAMTLALAHSRDGSTMRPGYARTGLPGTRQAYDGITLGFYEAELLRRVNPEHRSLGKFFEEEIAPPLGLPIRLPQSIPDSRLATITRPSLILMLRGFGIRFLLEAANHRSNLVRALHGSSLRHKEQHVYARS